MHATAGARPPHDVLGTARREEWRAVTHRIHRLDAVHPQRETSWSPQPRTNRGRRVLLGNEVLDFLLLSSINKVAH
jgi:hypothetical protein